MKKYQNIKYLNIAEYDEILKKEKDKKDFLITEIDFKDLESIDSFQKYLELKLKCPAHYFTNLDAISEAFIDFPEFNKKNKMVVLLKNYDLLIHLDKKYHEIFLRILDSAVHFFIKSKTGLLKVYVFINKNELEKIKKIDFEKTLSRYNSPAESKKWMKEYMKSKKKQRA